MTLDEARAAVGRRVTYHAPGMPGEHGVIHLVGHQLVFVRYGGDQGTKATNPADLTLG